MNQALKNIAPVASIARHASDGVTINVLGAPYEFKAASAETGNSFCCIEGRIPAGSGVPPHTHTHEDEAFYVLAGKSSSTAPICPRHCGWVRVRFSLAPAASSIRSVTRERPMRVSSCSACPAPA